MDLKFNDNGGCNIELTFEPIFEKIKVVKKKIRSKVKEKKRERSGKSGLLDRSVS